jgi:5-hydroxyisourate hydrolase
MPGLSIHVVDVARGVVAHGMPVEVYAVGPPRRRLAGGRIAAGGTLEDPALAGVLRAGAYEAVLDVAAYYRSVGAHLPTEPFLGVVTFRFGVADPAQHYHLPMKVTPWGLSCFRGGA